MLQNRNLSLIKLILFFVLFNISALLIYEIGHAVIELSIPHSKVSLDGSCFIPIDVIANDPEGFLSWSMIIEYDANVVTYLTLDQNTLLGKKHTLLTLNEVSPGKINIGGLVQYSTITGEDIPIQGTGTLLKLKFTTKRQYPMWRVKSDIIMKFKNSPNNYLRHAVTLNGSLEIEPNLQISHVEPSKGLFCEDQVISIYGQGFDEGAIPIIGSIQVPDIIFLSNQIKALVPANKLPDGLFFDIIVTNPNGDFGIFHDGYRLEHKFETGLNLFGYPTIPPEEYDSLSELLAYLDETKENIKCLKAFDPNSSSWHNAYWNKGNPSGTDLKINILQSSIMYVQGSDFLKAFPGNNYDSLLEDQISDLSIKTLPGLNLIAIYPPPDETILSDMIVQKISQKSAQAVTISRIVTKTSRWETNFSFFGHINGPKFPIRNVEGYILFRYNDLPEN